ncbi:MAG: hypothetical protein DHS20C05_09540 [Hyphococcus sp.]|nr:MAG: hypothetical protein DHS20C05_09540 [Marinicaulis sp.]
MDALFIEETPLSDEELLDARGGFEIGGFQFNFGVSLAPVQVDLPPVFGEGGVFGENGGPLPEGGIFGEGGVFGENGGPLPEGGIFGEEGVFGENGGPLPEGGVFADGGPLAPSVPTEAPAAPVEPVTIAAAAPVQQPAMPTAPAPETTVYNEPAPLNQPAAAPQPIVAQAPPAPVETPAAPAPVEAPTVVASAPLAQTTQPVSTNLVETKSEPELAPQTNLVLADASAPGRSTTQEVNVNSQNAPAPQPEEPTRVSMAGQVEQKVERTLNQLLTAGSTLNNVLNNDIDGATIRQNIDVKVFIQNYSQAIDRNIARRSAASAISGIGMLRRSLVN